MWLSLLYSFGDNLFFLCSRVLIVRQCLGLCSTRNLRFAMIGQYYLGVNSPDLLPASEFRHWISYTYTTAPCKTLQRHANTTAPRLHHSALLDIHKTFPHHIGTHTDSKVNNERFLLILFCCYYVQILFFFVWPNPSHKLPTSVLYDQDNSSLSTS